VGGDAWEVRGRGGRKGEESEMGGGDVSNKFLKPHNLHFCNIQFSQELICLIQGQNQTTTYTNSRCHVQDT